MYTRVQLKYLIKKLINTEFEFKNSTSHVSENVNESESKRTQSEKQNLEDRYMVRT